MDLTVEKEGIGEVAELSADRVRKITKLQTEYVHKHEESQMNKARRKKVLFRRLTVFFILVAIVVTAMISTLLSQNVILSQKMKEKEQLQEELASLKKDEVVLREEVVKLNNDEYIANLARKEYFLSEDDEIIFTLPEEEKSDKEKTPK
jgi:cell division protein DivIC